MEQVEKFKNFELFNRLLKKNKFNYAAKLGETESGALCAGFMA